MKSSSKYKSIHKFRGLNGWFGNDIQRTAIKVWPDKLYTCDFAWPLGTWTVNWQHSRLYCPLLNTRIFGIYVSRCDIATDVINRTFCLSNAMAYLGFRRVLVRI